MKISLKLSQYLFFVLISIQLVLMLSMSFDAGISADERRHILHAEKVYNYFKTKGEDKSALENTGIDPMQYNGQSFDNLMYVIQKIFKVDNYMEMRHFFNALTGWLIILITGLIAKELWGYKEAVLAVVLMFITPRFLGHAMNNNKDIPFAFGFILSFYGIILFLKELPKIKWTTMLILITGIGYAISIRLAGILSIGFLGIFSFIYYFSLTPIKKPFSKNKRITLKKLLIFVPVVIISGYILGIIFWPFMISGPVSNFKIVFDAMSTHPIKLNQLFDGEIYLSNNLPADYTIKYILITYPLFVLAGIVLTVLLFPFNLKRGQWLNHFSIFSAFLFVVVWMSLKNSNIYGEIRHLLFIYPLAILVTVTGFKYLHDLSIKSVHKPIQYIPYLILIVLAFNPVKHIIKNYPYSYVYFNELAGGTSKAAYNYETDYFQHSLKHATEWLVKNELNGVLTEDSIKIVTNDEFNVNYYLKNSQKNIGLSYTRYYEKYNKDWDYGIFYCGYISPNQLKEKLWPPKGTIHTEMVDGFPIAAVVKRISDDDYKGFEALKFAKTEEARNHLTNYLATYHENEEAWEGLAKSYYMERNNEKTIEYADSSLKYNPRQIGAVFLKAAALNNLQKYDEAILYAQKCTELQESFAEGYYQKGFALKRINKPNEALVEFQKAIGYKSDYYEAYMQMGDIFINYKKYKDAIEKIYKKAFELRENDLYATVFTAKCYHFLGDNNKADELITKLGQNQQFNFDVIKLKCRIEIDKANYNNAAGYLNMARNIQNNSELFLIRALYSYAVKDINSSKMFTEKAIELDNTNNEAKEFLKRFQASNIAIAQTNKQENQQSVLAKGETNKTNRVDLFEFDD